VNIKLLFLILTSVSLSAIAQVILKFGMSNDDTQQALARGLNRLDTILVIASSNHVILGLLIYGVGAILWLLVLANLDVSFAYPFVGLGFILTMLFGSLFLGEPFGAMRITGTLFVVVGIVLVARS
jgi:multidrug transporter EmrE-like cation transporter